MQNIKLLSLINKAVVAIYVYVFNQSGCSGNSVQAWLKNWLPNQICPVNANDQIKEKRLEYDEQISFEVQYSDNLQYLEEDCFRTLKKSYYIRYLRIAMLIYCNVLVWFYSSARIHLTLNESMENAALNSKLSRDTSWCTYWPVLNVKTVWILLVQNDKHGFDAVFVWEFELNSKC